MFNEKPETGELRRLIPFVREYQRLAETQGIKDIFQDNGGKLLQVLLVLGLNNLEGREGNDATTEEGDELELKSLNRQLVKGFSTHHHLNPTILRKYRQVDWVFAVYDNIELAEIYWMTPQQLEPYFSMWEEKWHASGGKDINNPKIPLKFVAERGELVFKGPLVP